MDEKNEMTPEMEYFHWENIFIAINYGLMTKRQERKHKDYDMLNSSFVCG